MWLPLPWSVLFSPHPALAMLIFQVSAEGSTVPGEAFSDPREWRVHPLFETVLIQWFWTEHSAKHLCQPLCQDFVWLILFVCPPSSLWWTQMLTAGCSIPGAYLACAWPTGGAPCLWANEFLY